MTEFVLVIAACMAISHVGVKCDWHQHSAGYATAEDCAAVHEKVPADIPSRCVPKAGIDEWKLANPAKDAR